VVEPTNLVSNIPHGAQNSPAAEFAPTITRPNTPSAGALASLDKRLAAADEAVNDARGQLNSAETNRNTIRTLRGDALGARYEAMPRSPRPLTRSARAWRRCNSSRMREISSGRSIRRSPCVRARRGLRLIRFGESRRCVERIFKASDPSKQFCCQVCGASWNTANRPDRIPDWASRGLQTTNLTIGHVTGGARAARKHGMTDAE
jgi:hypothetical protein